MGPNRKFRLMLRMPAGECPERAGEARRPGLVFFVDFSRSAAKYADVLGYLDGRYRRREEGGLIIYTLDAAGGAERGSKP
jgi:hypothetical protein